eukprot:2565882-Amphidinium_carterae.1
MNRYMTGVCTRSLLTTVSELSYSSPLFLLHIRKTQTIPYIIALFLKVQGKLFLKVLFQGHKLKHFLRTETIAMLSFVQYDFHHACIHSTLAVAVYRA